MARKRKRPARAFTLIEAMIAGSILAVGATGVLGAYSMTMGLIEHQRRLVMAVNATQGQLEELMSARADSPLLAGNQNVTVDGLGRPNPVFEPYVVGWTINHGVPASGYMEIVVKTTWNETRGSRNVSFVAFREE